MENDRDRELAFVEEIKQTLREKGGELDPEILVKLSCLQGRVIEERRSGFAGLWRLLRLPFLALFAAGLIAIFTLAFFRGPATMRHSFAGLDQLDLLVAPEEPNFYANLNFYAWMSRHRTKLSPDGEDATGKPGVTQ